MNYTISLLYSSIFSGTEVLVPILFILNALKVQFANINKQALVYSINCLLLFGSTLFAISLLSELFVAYYSQSEYMQFSFSNRLAGPYWLDIWLTGVLSFIILPQILWIKKLRRSLMASLIIVGMWIVLYFVKQALIAYQAWNTEFKLTYAEYIIQTAVYVGLLLAAYLIIQRKNSNLVTT